MKRSTKRLKVSSVLTGNTFVKKPKEYLYKFTHKYTHARAYNRMGKRERERENINVRSRYHAYTRAHRQQRFSRFSLKAIVVAFLLMQYR